MYRAKCKNNGLEVAIKMVSVTFYLTVSEFLVGTLFGNTPWKFINSLSV